MQHHILVKWSSEIADRHQTASEVRTLFEGLLRQGLCAKVEVMENIIDRPNRYDLLIRLTMAEADLPRYDACEIHHFWKEHYGPFIEKKAIFDAE